MKADRINLLGGNPEELQLRIAVLHADEDSAIASELLAGLSDSGLNPAGLRDGEVSDGAIVLISAAALGDPDWIAAASELNVSCIVPVRIGRLSEERVPKPLRDLNWIDWDERSPAVGLGQVLAGLLADPDRYRLSRQLMNEAQAWERAGRPDSLLISDRGRARRVVEMLDQLSADPIASPDPLAIEFAFVSNRRTKRSRRRRFLSRAGAGLAILIAISAATTVIPAIRDYARISKAAIVTAGDRSILERLPEWSAANAAMLIFDGTETQHELGTRTLIAALERPWAIGSVDYIDSVTGSLALPGGKRAAVLALTPDGTAFGLVDIRRGLKLGAMQVPRRFEHLDTTRNVVAVAGEGAGVIRLNPPRFHFVASQGKFVGVRISGSDLLLWNDSGDLERRPIEGKGRSLIGSYRTVIDVAGDGRGGGSALVESAPGRYAVIDLKSGRVKASGELGAGEAVGGLAPDRARAIVDGADGQFWILAPGRSPKPSGITVPISATDAAWASGELLLLASDSELGQVFFLPRAEQIASICGLSPSVQEIRVDPKSSIVSCGASIDSWWALPEPPTPADLGSLSGEPPRRLSGQGIHAEIRGRTAQVSRGDLSLRIQPFDGEITTAALNPRAPQLALGSSDGEVLVLALAGNRGHALLIWRAPDTSAVRKVDWSDGLTATTASAQRWQLPDCSGCETERGLLAAATARFSGCFSSRQMTWITAEDRDRLGLRECEPIAPLLGG